MPSSRSVSSCARYSARGCLAHPRQPAAGVGGEEEHELDPRLAGGRRGRLARLVEAEVVELADRGVAGAAHLGVGGRVELAHGRGRLPFRLGEHQLPPGPEVAAARAAA